MKMSAVNCDIPDTVFVSTVPTVTGEMGHKNHSLVDGGWRIEVLMKYQIRVNEVLFITIAGNTGAYD